MITRLNKQEIITLTYIKSSFGGVGAGKRPLGVDLKEEEKWRQ